MPKNSATNYINLGVQGFDCIRTLTGIGNGLVILVTKRFRTVVATEYLGAGYDDNIQFIYIYGWFGITTLIQMIGRGGQGGGGCKVKILCNISMFNNSMKNTFSIPATAKITQEELIITLQVITNPLYECFHVMSQKQNLLS